MSQVAADLRAAADVLERDGWMQGGYVIDGCRCVLGSLLVPVQGEWAQHPDDMTLEARVERFDPAVNALLGYLGFGYGYGLHLVDWNDAPGRTADEVIATLRAAADRAEEK